jgi:hypothetical protein
LEAKCKKTQEAVRKVSPSKSINRIMYEWRHFELKIVLK